MLWVGVIGEIGDCNGDEDEDEDDDNDLIGMGPPLPVCGGTDDDPSEDVVMVGWRTKIEFFLLDTVWDWDINLSWNMSMPFNCHSLISEGRKSNPGGIE